MSAFAYSRLRPHRLFGLALFAWLLLALSPMANAGIGGDTGMAATAVQALHQDVPVHDVGCCADGGQPAHPTPTHSCSCAMLCAAVLPATVPSIVTVARVAERPAPPPSLDAPLSGFAPPLRPPLA